MDPGLRLGMLGLLLPSVLLIGCAVPQGPTSTTPPADNWTNWQIQAGPAITSPPNTYPSFLGAIQIKGSQASGIFTTVESTGNGAGLDYSGSYAPATGDVTISTFGFGFSYTEPSSAYTLVPVGVIGGCVYPPGYPGPECAAIIDSPSVGVTIAPLNGTYTGTISDASTPGFDGQATLTLTQSTAPNSDGSFPLNATIAFPTASALGSDALAGKVSGEGLTMSLCSPAVVGPCITLTGSTNPAGTQITVSSLQFNDPGRNINATFTGTLTSQ